MSMNEVVRMVGGAPAGAVGNDMPVRIAGDVQNFL